jgi:hypothetical protein
VWNTGFPCDQIHRSFGGTGNPALNAMMEALAMDLRA